MYSFILLTTCYDVKKSQYNANSMDFKKFSQRFFLMYQTNFTIHLIFQLFTFNEEI